VLVSKALVRDVNSRLGFLGRVSIIAKAELRGHVGGALTGSQFRDGDIVKKGDLLFMIDARPCEIEPALNRAQFLATNSTGAEQVEDECTAVQRSARAAVCDAKAQICDAELDLRYCRFAAPFGRHLSFGNLITGSRTARPRTPFVVQPWIVDGSR
jgi:multidrug resistance efflux pump